MLWWWYRWWRCFECRWWFSTDANETTDSDADGIGDNADICPEDADVGQADIDSDGQGDSCDTDIDGDGVLTTLKLL